MQPGVATIFYDGDCGLCHRAVRVVLGADVSFPFQRVGFCRQRLPFQGDGSPFAGQQAAFH